MILLLKYLERHVSQNVQNIFKYLRVTFDRLIKLL